MNPKGKIYPVASSRKSKNIYPVKALHIILVSACIGFFVISSCQRGEQSLFQEPTPQKPTIPYYFQNLFAEPADNPTTAEGIALGRALFFEKRLSENGTISCATCHQPEKAFTDGLAKSKGIYDQELTRNAPSLYNAGLFQRLFWDGRESSLESQSLHPIHDEREMNLNLDEAVLRLKKIPGYPAKFGKAFGSVEITSEKMARALAQFERSLVSADSKYDRFLKGQYLPTTEEQIGMALFFTHPNPFAPPNGLRGGNCGDCHLPQVLVGNQNGFDGFHNTGLNTNFGPETDLGLEKFTGKAMDRGKFKTPGLRNIALTAPYMHDGRFKTLEEVLDHYNHEELFERPNVDPLITAGTNIRNGTSLGLTEPEKKAIIAFLRMLTDSSATRSF